MDAEAVRRRAREHTDAVGRADVGRLRALYAEDARLYDPVGSQPVVGRAAIAAHFDRWLAAPRAVTATRVLVGGPDSSRAAVFFTATPEAGHPVDIVDVMTFGDDLLITEILMIAEPSRD